MTEGPFRIRDARTEDLAVILHLWAGMMADHETADPRVRLAPGARQAYESYLTHHLDHEDSCVRVAAAGSPERVIGFYLLTINRNLPMFLPPRYGYLSDMVVEEAWRRRGVGRALVADAREWLRARQIRCVQLQVYARNPRAQVFWNSMGFVAYYQRMWLDLL